MEANNIETRSLIISVAAVLSTEVAAKIATSRGLCYPMIILGAARLLETLLIVLIVMIRGKGLVSIGLARFTMLPGLKKGMIWSACFGIVAAFVFVILLATGINALTLVRTNLPPRHGELALFFFIGGIVGPIAEELFFRGMLYGFLRRWGMVTAVVLSTLIFVLSHPLTHGFPVTQAIGGIVFAVAYEAEGSLMTPIAIHILGNLSIFTLSVIS
jgi:membrane protease YdiL (CAAX protease family)